ncbi:hypothetical protein AEB_P1931 [Altererythrobacter sp. B11]|uniref:TolC family protein n=1 Tax=Altererythrobacter sp. B11 TaxID=2060312 RepID=UPI000DC735FC|nr:TolC family protein [Altererythrobacter sp. B11]BBC72799.1 hypothetical protein AEB_P1931 [Altererythrobacter sp. B11]
MITGRYLSRAAMLAALPLVAGCALAPKAPPPTLSQLGIADSYSWQSAGFLEASDAQASARWWRMCADPVLEGLIGQAIAAGPREGLYARAAALGNAYFAMRGAQRKIANLQDYITTQDDLLRLAQFRHEAELVPALDAALVMAARDRAAADMPLQQAAIDQARATIAALIGRTPAEVAPELATEAPIPSCRAEWGGLRPSQLAEQRDDLRKAADRYGSEGLLGGLGGRSVEAEQAYRQTLLTAYADVESARASYTQAAEREDRLTQAQISAGQVAALARDSYRRGEASYPSLERAESALLATRNALADAQMQRATAAVAFSLALGVPPEPAADEARDTARAGE